MRKIPMRNVWLHKKDFQKELIRVVRTPEKTIEVDPTGKMNGHGAYVSKRKETISLAKKNHALDRALEMEIPEEVYTKLLEYVDE